MNEMDERRCPLCSGKMIRGYLHDFSPGTQHQRWYEQTKDEILKKRERSYEIVSFRCEKCNYLLNFAPEVDPIKELRDQLK